MNVSIRLAWVNIVASYRARKAGLEPDLRRWEFVVQMLCSAYLSWRWLGNSARFQPFSPQYWLWVAQYSSLSELGTRASLAAANNLRPRSDVPFNRTFTALPFQLETGEQLQQDALPSFHRTRSIQIERGASSATLPRTTRPNPAADTRP